MANIVDELIIALKLDNKQFQKGAKDAEGQLNKVKDTATTASKNLQQQGKKGAVFFTELQKSALKFFSVMTIGAAGFRAFANLISNGANLSRLATNLGTSANSLHQWGQAVKQSGGTVAGFESTMRGLSAALTEQQTTGTSGISGWLSVLGVGLVDAEGKAKKVETLLLDIGEAVQRKTSNRADQFNILQSMGIDEGSANLILKNRKEAEALIASQPGMSDAAAKKAQDINERWEALVERVRGKVRELAIQHFPAIERAVIAISNAFERMSPFITTMTEGFSELNKITDGWLTNILLALGALKLVKGFIPGVGAAAAGGIGAGGAIAAGAAGYAGYQAGSLLYDKAIAGTSAGDVIGKGVAKVLSFFGNKDAKEAIESNERYKRVQSGQEVSGKVTLNQALGVKPSPLPEDLQEKIANAEKKENLPSGVLGSIIQQETGGKKEYLNDPSKYHYELNSEGKRIAPHTGKVSTAFGPFGLLESTAKNPGYGVKPIKDKSIDEQIRFASEYLAARVKNSGSIRSGLAGYGEGEKYANQVLARLPKEKNNTPIAPNSINEFPTAAENAQYVNQVLGKLQGSVMSGVPSGAINANQPSTAPQITIGKIDIQTAATDARGIARDIRHELTAQANTGMR